MTDTLNDKEVKRLGELGQVILGCLSCAINDNNIPCRTDRLEAVNHMIGYLSIHGYKITRPSNKAPLVNGVHYNHKKPTKPIVKDRWDKRDITLLLNRRD